MGHKPLMQVLHQLPPVEDKDLLVGVENADDAGVYRISEETAVVSTLDFFPPMVDDARDFGAIAAANALSDVYAMGATPKFALNIVCFPKELPVDVLALILDGAAEKLSEAGAVLAGGHSVEDHEVKFGLSVTGLIDPAGIVTNSGSRPGDALVLTKPLGVGVITSAVKAGRLKEGSESFEAALKSMKTLNRDAAGAVLTVGVNACTDVTGYGLIGHAMEMARGSGVDMVVRSSEVEFFPEALRLVEKRSCRPRSIRTGMESLGPDVDASKVDTPTEMLLYDPQTSGGFLISVAAEKKGMLIDALAERGVEGRVIGEAVERGGRVRIRVV